MVQQIKNPGCLGQMAQRYCRYCSDRCPITPLCVLVLMGEYLRREHEVPPSQPLIESAQPLTIPPLIVLPDEHKKDTKESK